MVWVYFASELPKWEVGGQIPTLALSRHLIMRRVAWVCQRHNSEIFTFNSFAMNILQGIFVKNDCFQYFRRIRGGGGGVIN